MSRVSKSFRIILESYDKDDDCCSEDYENDPFFQEVTALTAIEQFDQFDEEDQDQVYQDGVLIEKDPELTKQEFTDSDINNLQATNKLDLQKLHSVIDNNDYTDGKRR